jgi:hypothetical protein
LLYLTVDQVERLAAEPIPYDLPASSSPSPRLVADWNEVAGEIRRDAERQARYAAGNGEARARINPLTRRLIIDPTAI